MTAPVPPSADVPRSASPAETHRIDPQHAAMATLLGDARRRLVDTGTRNRLIHVNRANLRANVVNVVNENADAVYAMLTAGRTLRFRALGTDEPAAAEQAVSLAAEAEEPVTEARLRDTYLETLLGPDALAKRLLSIAREARTAEEEQGVNILYLALGFLTWFEDPSSKIPREAPLVLLPVELVRNNRTATYDVRLRDEDPMTNLPLQRRLQGDFGILLPELEIGDDWQPSQYVARVEAMLAGRAGWRVDADGIQLGFFSFAKLLMFLDLDDAAWPGGLTGLPLTSGLLYRGFDADPPLFGDEQRLDPVLPPDRLVHVVSADASQTRVIEEVRTGRNLVVQGPPGTGKSQTIANIIATAARDGKTVLFVAEKMAALSVVHHRLVQVGLPDVCLELHSRTANKKAVLAELSRTLNAALTTPAPPGPPTALTQARDRLNQADEILHAPLGATGETPHSVLSRQVQHIRAGARPPTLDVPVLITMPRAVEAELAATIRQLGTAVDAMGAPERHPFAGADPTLDPVEVSALPPALTATADAMLRLRDAIGAARIELGVPGPATGAAAEPLVTTLAALDGLHPADAALARRLLDAQDPERLDGGLIALEAWTAARTGATPEFRDAAFTTPADQLAVDLAKGTNLVKRWGGDYRKATTALAALMQGAAPAGHQKRLAAVSRLVDLQQQRAVWSADEPFLADALGDDWRGEQTDVPRARWLLGWARGVAAVPVPADRDRLVALAARPGVAAGLRTAISDAERQFADSRRRLGRLLPDAHPIVAPAADLDAAAEALRRMAGNVDRYGEWATFRRRYDPIAAAGVEPLAIAVATGQHSAADAVVELSYARARAMWRAALASWPALRTLDSLDRDALVATFRRLEADRLLDNVAAIRAAHLAQVPLGASGEMRVVRGEIGKSRRHLPIRQLFLRAPAALQRIKPVLLMSPISVAQFIAPGTVTFDLLVIDEASQVRPEDALGAVARARQIVVVGDQKQLPPSSFFEKILSDEQDDIDLDADASADDPLEGAAGAAEMESILSLCEARGLGPRMLRWHYRSRDPSLIRVSNREFYGDQLVLPPSPLELDGGYGLSLTRVDGVYDRGGKRDNRVEAQAVVDRIAAHAQAHPDRSLGVVTFSISQRNTIEELLELDRRSDPVLDAFLRLGHHEDLFVKSIENVQGDERDVILISVGYGPATPGGRLATMNFGPVNGDGGERRLNVLFTRARLSCEVFASFDPGDIDLARTTRDGPRVLKRFLEYAASGGTDLGQDRPAGSSAPSDSPFEDDVATEIRAAGFLADVQVGSAGFRIDIGVRHPDRPERYLLAVECDGATYHGAVWARERDRLRQDVLEGLGWRFHRVWSTDWFYRRADAVRRLRAALEDAHRQAAAGITVVGANDGGVLDQVPEAAPADLPVDVPVAAGAPSRQLPPYRRAAFPAPAGGEPHLADPVELARLADRIVRFEGPIHADEVARRIAASFGKEQAGARIATATRAALAEAARRDKDLVVADDFWMTKAQLAQPAVRDRSAEAGSTRNAEYLSLPEIRAALDLARADNAGGSDAELIRAAARLLGYKVVRSGLQARLAEGLPPTT